MGFGQDWLVVDTACSWFFDAMGYMCVRAQTVACGGVELRNCYMEKALEGLASA